MAGIATAWLRYSPITSGLAKPLTVVAISTTNSAPGMTTSARSRWAADAVIVVDGRTRP